jgi:isopenicillin N synthase-like dioxygenase
LKIYQSQLPSAGIAAGIRRQTIFIFLFFSFSTFPVGVVRTFTVELWRDGWWPKRSDSEQRFHAKSKPYSKRMSTAITCDVVELDYNDLVAGKDLSAEVERAFGVDGAGLLTVKNVPGYVEARSKLLPLSKSFADLPDEVKDKYVLSDAYYAFGWSHGKEKLQAKPDYSKGSFYANPQYDRPVDDEDTIAKYPSFVHPNIWPKEELPELETAFKALGQVIISVGKLVAKQADKFVRSKCPTYPENNLENTIETSLCCKARLLHYFPIANDDSAMDSADNEFSSWCGWHNDHGSLTGLTSALYLDENGNQVVNTDKTAGMHGDCIAHT